MSVSRERILLAAIDALREGEGNAVTIVCINPEGTGPDNEAVEIVADWTAWETKRFEGYSIGGALSRAMRAAPAAVRSRWLSLSLGQVQPVPKELHQAIRELVERFRGTSGMGENYWEQFPEYQLLAAIADREGAAA